MLWYSLSTFFLIFQALLYVKCWKTATASSCCVGSACSAGKSWFLSSQAWGGQWRVPRRDMLAGGKPGQYFFTEEKKILFDLTQNKSSTCQVPFVYFPWRLSQNNHESLLAPPPDSQSRSSQHWESCLCPSRWQALQSCWDCTKWKAHLHK